MVPAPHLPTVGNVCKLLLEYDDPAEAGDAMVAILNAIADGLERQQGWTRLDAIAFACRFGNTVNSVLRAVRDRHTAVIH